MEMVEHKGRRVAALASAKQFIDSIGHESEATAGLCRDKNEEGMHRDTATVAYNVSKIANSEASLNPGQQEHVEGLIRSLAQRYTNSRGEQRREEVLNPGITTIATYVNTCKG